MIASASRILKKYCDYAAKALKVLKAIEFSSAPAHDRVLFICSDADRWQTIHSKHYSPILDPIYSDLVRNGVQCSAVSIPYSCHKKDQTYLGYRNINLIKIKYGVDYWEAFFQKFGAPKAIVGLGIGKSLCRIARRRSIPVIEVMHGFGISEDDYAYGSEKRSLHTEYEEPTHYIVFDPISFATFSPVTYGGKVITKLARHYAFTSHQTNSINSQSESILTEVSKVISTYKTVVLYTMQHGYDGTRAELNGIIPNGLLLDEVINSINSSKEILWLLKPHPTQLAHPSWKRNLAFIKKQLKFRNYFIEEIQNVRVVDLVQIADVHVTMGSGSVVEAALYMVPSIGLCPTLRAGGVLSSAYKHEERAELFIRCDLENSNLVDIIFECARNSHKKKAVTKQSIPQSEFMADGELCSASEIIMKIINTL